MIEFLKKSWKAIVGVLGAIVGLILLRQYFTKVLLAKLGLVKSEKDSAVIDAKVEAVKDNLKTEEANSAKLREAANKPAEALDSKSVEDYWKKN